MEYDNQKKMWLKELIMLEKKAKLGECTAEEHRLIFIYRYLLQLIPAYIYWLSEV